MKKYPKTKPSGVEWIGDVPEVWEIKKLKYATSFVNGFAFKSEEYVEEGIPIVRIGDIQPSFSTDEMKKVPIENLEKAKEFLIRKGDILIALTGATIGKNFVFNLEGNFLLNQRVGIIRPLDKIERSFLRHVISSNIFKEFIDVTCGGSAQDNIGKSQLDNFFVQLPPLPEQTAIAAYLDRKTVQIDQSIAEKEGLIELFREERQAIINHAVTKGIRPGAKMKPSGVEWIGDVPEGWAVKRLKYLGKIKYGLGQPPPQKEDGIPLIRATNVERGKIVEKDLICVDPNEVPYERDPVLRANDIIIVRSGAYTADSAIIPPKFEGAITGYDMVFRAEKCEPKYIAFALLSHSVLEVQLLPQTLRAAQPHLNREELGETVFVLPTERNEQIAITAYIDQKTTQIDTAISGIRQEIALLQEYRQALIFEAVTGKIDVREMA